MKMKKRLLPVLITGSIIGISQAAQAQVFQQVHKWTDTAKNKTYVYIMGQTPDTPANSLTTPKVTTKAVTSNSCGWVRILNTNQTITNITGAGINFAGKTSASSAPTCETNPSAATGTVIDTGVAYFIKLSQTTSAGTLEISENKPITSKANKCGFIRIATSESRPMTTFTLNGSNHSLSTLASVTAPIICRKVSETESKIYAPYTVPSGG